jgi:hypothetical protein
MAAVEIYTQIRSVLTYSESDDVEQIRLALKSASVSYFDYEPVARAGSPGVFNVTRDSETNELIIHIGEPTDPSIFTLPSAATIWADSLAVAGAAELLGYRRI